MSAAAPIARKRRTALLVIPRSVALVHRWLGILIGFMFALWFASGAVLCFVPFPLLGANTRIAHSERIALDRVRIGPAAALAAAPDLPAQRLRLISVAGHPRYVLSAPGRGVVSVSAESGRVLEPLSAASARTVAEHFGARPVADIDGPLQYDQWTVHDEYNPFRPFYRLHLQDQAGTVLYVSTRSGEVLQRTRRRERDWNRVGAVIHWVNWVWLRRHKSLWRWTMLTMGGACLALALLGLFLGVVHLINSKRLRRPGLSYFRGWLRWHHVIGLFTGTLLLTWAVSGCLMLDAGTLFPSDQPTASKLADIQGMGLAIAAAQFPISLLSELPPAREIEVTALAGQPYVIVRTGGNRPPQLAGFSAPGRLSLLHGLPDSQLLSAVRLGWPNRRVLAIKAVSPDDSYQVLAHPLPRTARRIVLDDSGHTWVQMDSATGRILSVTDSRSRTRRWLVQGLHDFDFPMLDRAGPLRLILLVLATTAGFLFSCTGMVLGIRRLLC